MSKGFTLVEILIIIGIMAILATAIILTVNPPRQFAQTRNTQRWSNVNTIIDAIYRNINDNGKFICPAGELPKTVTPIKGGTNGYDLCRCLVSTYIGSIPFDPLLGTAHYNTCDDYDSGYTIAQSDSNRITINAAAAELDANISVSK